MTDVLFGAPDSRTVAGQVNNIVDSTSTIKSLWYLHGASPNTNHTTRINSGVTLNIIGTTNITGGTGFTPGNFSLLVGTNASVTPSMVATITGGGGWLNIDNPTGILAVAQFNTASRHTGVNLRATLNMSGLDTFTANLGQVRIGSMNNGSAGIWYLARTNVVTARSSGSAASPQWVVGDNNANQGDPSHVYLGVTNGIFIDNVAFSRAKGTNGSMSFNPAFLPLNPVARFRAQDGSSRISTWVISDLLSANGTPDVTKPVGTNDFTGGTVDALIDSLVLGKTTTTVPSSFATSNRVSTGTLTFNAGTIDVNTLTNGWQLGNANSGTASWDSAIGVVNVNGGTLRVNDRMVLAKGVTSISPAVVQGTLNVRNGTLAANRILNGGGNARITLTNATLFLTNGAGVPSRGITTFNLTNSTLHVTLDGNSVGTNMVVTNLIASGISLIAIDSVSNVASTINFPLFSYALLVGSVTNFSLGPLPPDLTGQLIDNTENKTIDLRITHSVVSTPAISSLTLSLADLIVSGTNGVPNWSYYLLASTNVALPLTNWTPVATGLFDGTGNFRLTNSLDLNVSQRFYLLQVP